MFSMSAFDGITFVFASIKNEWAHKFQVTNTFLSEKY